MFLSHKNYTQFIKQFRKQERNLTKKNITVSGRYTIKLTEGPIKGKKVKVVSEKVGSVMDLDAYESARAVFAKIDELAASGVVSWSSLPPDLHSEAKDAADTMDVLASQGHVLSVATMATMYNLGEFLLVCPLPAIIRIPDFFLNHCHAWEVAS